MVFLFGCYLDVGIEDWFFVSFMVVIDDGSEGESWVGFWYFLFWFRMYVLIVNVLGINLWLYWD